MNDFDDMPDLDEVFDPLRSAATPDELSQEAAILERMVRVRRTAEGKRMFTSRRARVATLVAAGVLGFGGMAAASPALLGQRPAESELVVGVGSVGDETDEPADEVESPDTIEPTESESAEEAVPVDEIEPVEVESVGVAPVGAEPLDDIETIVPAAPVEVPPTAAGPADAPLVDDPATAFDETTCLPGNHGATVSAVARGEFPDGVSVTDAAHSSCGKATGVDAVDPEADDEAEHEDGSEVEDGPEVETPDTEAELDQEHQGRDDGHSNGHGHSNGNGNGNGAGNGHSNGTGHDHGNGNGNGNGNGGSGKRDD